MSPRVAAVETGCDRLLSDPSGLVGRPYALLAHAASIDRRARPLHQALADSAAGPPRALFSPEHGYYGVEQDMIPSDDAVDPLSGIPILSLYGEGEHTLVPAPEAFAGLEVLVVDLQDVGSRYYTYAATAIWAARVALEAGLEVWVLDRPNPLGGAQVEGPPVDPGFDSFVGAFDWPVRHGLTLAELVRLEAQRGGWQSEGLRFWTMTGWNPRAHFDGTGLPWVAPSPNMPTLATARVYPGGCLIEGTALSEGRGTTRPFELVGAPEVDPKSLVTTLEGAGLAGVRLVPTFFKPQFQKHAGRTCGGVQVLVSDPQVFEPLRCGVELLAALRWQMGDAFAWRAEAYEFVTDRPAIDLLAGGPVLRRALDAGDRPALDDWIAGWARHSEQFAEASRAIHLYPRTG